MQIDHIGIATETPDELASIYEELFDAPVVHDETSNTKGMRYVFLEIGDAYFELIQPMDPGSVIGRYLADHSSGIHHIALVTDDIEGALDAARSHGVALIDESPRAGAWGHDIAFLHPKSTGGALIEYVQHTS